MIKLYIRRIKPMIEIRTGDGYSTERVEIKEIQELREWYPEDFEDFLKQYIIKNYSKIVKKYKGNLVFDEKFDKVDISDIFRKEKDDETNNKR